MVRACSNVLSDDHDDTVAAGDYIKSNSGSNLRLAGTSHTIRCPFGASNGACCAVLEDSFSSTTLLTHFNAAVSRLHSTTM